MIAVRMACQEFVHRIVVHGVAVAPQEAPYELCAGRMIGVATAEAVMLPGLLVTCGRLVQLGAERHAEDFEKIVDGELVLRDGSQETGFHLRQRAPLGSGQRALRGRFGGYVVVSHVLALS